MENSCSISYLESISSNDSKLQVLAMTHQEKFSIYGRESNLQKCDKNILLIIATIFDFKSF